MNPTLRLPVPDTRETSACCPACWGPVSAGDPGCDACGTVISRYLAEHDYGAELIDALRHPVIRRRLAAVWMLGERRERRAVPALRALALTERRYCYLGKTAVLALAKIGGADAAEALREIQISPTARSVGRAARAVSSFTP